MQHLRNLAVLAGMLCFGLSPAMAMSHEGGEGGEHGDHHGPPPPPPEMVEIIEDILEEGDLSDAAATMLGHLIAPPPPEGEEPPAPPEIPEEEMEAAKEEIAGIFEGLLEEDIPEPAEKYITMVLGHMAGEEMGPPPCGGGGDPCGGGCGGCGGEPMGGPCGGEGEHMGPPTPPPSLVEIIEGILEEGDLSDAAATMLGHLIAPPPPEGEEPPAPPEIPEEEMEAAKEEIAGIFGALLDDEDLPEDAAIYINMMLDHMDGEHMGPPPCGGCGGCGGDPCGGCGGCGG